MPATIFYFQSTTQAQLHHPPVVTPMLADELLDIPGMRALINFLFGK